MKSNTEKLGSSGNDFLRIGMERHYSEFRGMARKRLNTEPLDISLESADLVSETFLRFVQAKSVSAEFAKPGYLFTAAWRQMDRVLIDYARKKNAKKRGGGLRRVELDQGPFDDVDVHERTVLNDAVERLKKDRPEWERAFRSRFLEGRSIKETAAVSGVTIGTVRQRLLAARAWLQRHLGDLSK